MSRGLEKFGAAVMFESLEPRQMMSASVAKGAVVSAHATAAVHAKPQAVRKVVHRKAHAATVSPAPMATAWNDLVGNWSGTFTTNGGGGATGILSASFQSRVYRSNTGTYHLSAMVGVSAALTTVTPDAEGNVLVYISLKGGGSVSFIGGLSVTGKYMVGRWCSFVGTKYTTGTFQMTRP